MRLLALASLLVTGCWFEETSCPPFHAFTPGNYQSQGGQWRTGSGQFPHDGPAKTLTLERAEPGAGGGGTLTIRYQRNGKQVVERWLLSGSANWVPVDAGQ